MPVGYAGAVELRHLRYFVAVAAEQNITRAAAGLNVSQPSLSRQIRDLEDELGVALLVRSAKAVQLTEAGKVFQLEARAILQRKDEAVRRVRATASGERGEIHVAYAPSLTVEILPRALSAFQESNPGVRVRLHDLSTQEMLRGLRDGPLHVALMVQMSPKHMAGLVFEELRRFPVSVAMHPAHPLARRRAVGLKDIARERLVAFTLADYPNYHEWLADLFAPPLRVPGITEEHDSVTSLIAAVETGRGVAVVSSQLECLAGPRLKLLPVRPAPPPLIVGVARRERNPSLATTNFIAAARRASPRSTTTGRSSNTAKAS